MSSTAYLDIYCGDEAENSLQMKSYKHTFSLLEKHAASFGLPPSPEALTAEQQEILVDLNKGEMAETELLFQPPPPLLAGRIVFEFDPACPKTTQNFLALCTGEKGNVKSAPNKKLHYVNCPIHRVVQGFVAQGGDITRGDGSGGESIYGPKFPSEKPGLQSTPRFGSLAMANSGGKNPNNTSQFFVVLSNDSKTLDKLKGKYVVFGHVKAGDEGSKAVLQKLNEVGAKPGGKDEKPTIPVWIGGCGVS